jgi:SdpC family antimicrobial peptide
MTATPFQRCSVAFRSVSGLLVLIFTVFVVNPGPSFSQTPPPETGPRLSQTQPRPPVPAPRPTQREPLAPVPGPQPHDGVTLYRGMFFASGPVGGQIPTIRRVGPLLPAEYKALEPQAIQYIQAKDPRFFDEFAREIESGNHVRVANEIRRATAVHRQTMRAITSNSNSELAKHLRLTATLESEPDNLDGPVVFVVVVVVAVLLFWAQPMGPMLQGLTFDRYVDEVVRTFPAARPPIPARQ